MNERVQYRQLWVWVLGFCPPSTVEEIGGRERTEEGEGEGEDEHVWVAGEVGRLFRVERIED